MADVSQHDEDDWAPLTPEQLATRPGEHSADDEAVVRRRQPASHPQAERMLRELQDRIDNAPKSDSIVASVDRREQRARRKQQQGHRIGAAIAATCVQGELPAPRLELDSRASDCDPRELEDWFRDLPEPEQQRLRESWSGARHKHDQWGRDARRRMLRATGYGALCFLLCGILLIVLLGSVWHVPGFVVVGAICGPFAQLCGGQRFTYMATGALGYLVLTGTMLLTNPLLLYGLLFAIATMGAIGMDGEMRRSAGCRDD